MLRFADLELDPVSHQVKRGDRLIELTRTEFSLLELFMLHPRQVLTRPVIFERVWGYDFGPGSNSLEVYVSYLRRKTEAGGEPRLLHTVRGVGYVLREEMSGLRGASPGLIARLRRASGARPSASGWSCSRPRRSRSPSCSPPASRSWSFATSCAARSTTSCATWSSRSPIPQGLLLPGAPRRARACSCCRPARSAAGRVRAARATRRHGAPAARERRITCRSTSGCSRSRAGEREAFFSDATIGGVHARVYTAPLPTGDALQAVRPLEDVDRTLRDLAFALALSASAASRSRSGSGGSSRAPRSRR